MDIKKDGVWLMQGDCLERMKEIPDGSVDTILIDPPYVGMVNETWDRLSEGQAESMFEKLHKEAFRVLRYGGRFISFSSNDTLRWMYNPLFLHREILVVAKDVNSVSGGRNTKQYKQHVNCTEYIFVATKFAREHTKSLLLERKGALTSKQINSALGVATNGGGMWSIYTGNNKCQQVPTKDVWLKFQEVFEGLPDYESFEEVFNNGLSKGNVLTGFDFRFKGRLHPTQKPLELLEYIVSSYTRCGSLVLDCFAGSGTTGVACRNLNRKFIGIELDESYYQIAKERILGDVK